MNINWKWPASNLNDIAPAYIIAWRLLFMPLFAAGVLFHTLAILGMHGPKEAKKSFKDLWFN